MRKFDDFPARVALLGHMSIFLWSVIEQWAADHMNEIRPHYSEPMVTVAEAAARVGVHIGSVYRWIDRGRLSATKRKPSLVPVREVEELARSRRAGK